MKDVLLLLIVILWAVAHLRTGVAAQAIVAPMSEQISFESVGQRAITRWASSRECLFTQGASKYVTNSLYEATWALNSKAGRYKLTPQSAAELVDAAVASYLDEVSIRAFGPFRKECVVDLVSLRSLAFQPASRLGPDVGYLTVDGTRKGAAIQIDRQSKGYIAQTFVLSVGTHHWQTMKCDESIAIRADEHKKVYCRKQ